MKKTAAVMFIAAAFVMALAAVLPDQPEYPVSIQATWAQDQLGRQTLILKEVQLPKPMLFASPAARPQPPRPDKPNPAKPNPAFMAMQIQRWPCVWPFCAD